MAGIYLRRPQASGRADLPALRRDTAGGPVRRRPV